MRAFGVTWLSIFVLLKDYPAGRNPATQELGSEKVVLRPAESALTPQVSSSLKLNTIGSLADATTGTATACSEPTAADPYTLSDLR